MESHLLQMRGLKLRFIRYKTEDEFVASFTDAWIETSGISSMIAAPTSHLLQMRGLKLWQYLIQHIQYSRIFYRCVD